jgi:putative oxidoreductase
MSLIKKIFAPTPQSTAASTGFLVLRLIAGTAFILHGWGKMQAPLSWMGPEAPVPGVFQFLAAFSEFGGGIAWILGLLTPLASLGTFITMTVATLMHALALKDPFVASGPGQSSYEPALVYWGIALLLMLAGPGKFSLDALLIRRNRVVAEDGIRTTA